MDNVIPPEIEVQILQKILFHIYLSCEVGISISYIQFPTSQFRAINITLSPPALLELGYEMNSYKYNIRYRFYRFTSSSITKPSDFTSLV